MLKPEEWLEKVRIKLIVKEKKLLRKQVNGFQNIREELQHHYTEKDYRDNIP
jgi:hypothetical protein